MITWAQRAKAAISQKGQNGTANTDETAVARLLTVSSVPAVAVTALPERLSTVLAVPFHAILEKHDASIAVTEDPDRWCWPHSPAMNGSEIETFEVRMHQFTQKGLANKDAETLADKLMFHDRDLDDRRVCLECKHLSGHGAGSWRCGNWKEAGVAISSTYALLPADLVMQLQLCNGFTLHSTSKK